MRLSIAPFFLAPLSAAIGAVFLVMVVRPDLVGWTEAMPLPLRGVVAAFGALCVWMAVYTLRHALRTRRAVAHGTPQPCRLHLHSEDRGDSTSLYVECRVGGRDWRVHVRGGRAVGLAREAGDAIDGLAWTTPDDPTPLILAALGPDGPVAFDTYGTQEHNRQENHNRQEKKA